MKVSKYWRRALPVFGAAFLCTAAWAQEETPTTRPAYVDDILTKISELSTSVSTLSTNVDAISTSVAAIDTSVDSVSTSVAAVGTSVETLSGGVDAIDTTVDAISTSVAGVSTSVETLSGGVDVIDTTVDAISTSVAGVNTTVDALSGSVNDTGDDVDDVISKMNRLLRRMDELETAIEAVEAKAGMRPGQLKEVYKKWSFVPTSRNSGDWRTVVDHTGSGYLHGLRSWGRCNSLFPSNTSTYVWRYSCAEVRVTIDGSQFTLSHHDRPVDAVEVGPVYDLPQETKAYRQQLDVMQRFTSSLKVEIRDRGYSNRSLRHKLNLHVKVFYSEDLAETTSN